MDNKDLYLNNLKIIDKPTHYSKGLEQTIELKTRFVEGNNNDYYRAASSEKVLVDHKTGFVVGSQEYNDYYNPKIDTPGRHR